MPFPREVKTPPKIESKKYPRILTTGLVVYTAIFTGVLYYFNWIPKIAKYYSKTDPRDPDYIKREVNQNEPFTVMDKMSNFLIHLKTPLPIVKEIEAKKEAAVPKHLVEEAKNLQGPLGTQRQPFIAYTKANDSNKANETKQ